MPGVVQNLECSDENSSPFELAFSWELPRELGNEVIGYQVMVNRLEQRRGTREVFQSGVYNNFTETSGASISGLGNSNHCYHN